MQEMLRMKGRQFCPKVVDAFVRVLKSSGVIDPEQSEQRVAS